MRYLTLMAAIAVLLLPVSAHAIPVTFSAVLSGLNESPPNSSPATGFATVVLDAEAHTIQINAVFSNLGSNTTAAHIHCCVASPGTAGVATTLPAFQGFPLGVTSGTYVSPVFDLTQPLIYNPAFVTAQGGLAQAEMTLVNGIQNGQTYFNIHTMNIGAGEIRGFLTVPEPSSVVLLGLGIVGFILMRRQSRHPITQS
jgi:hypothetical protein